MLHGQQTGGSLYLNCVVLFRDEAPNYNEKLNEILKYRKHTDISCRVNKDSYFSALVHKHTVILRQSCFWILVTLPHLKPACHHG